MIDSRFTHIILVLWGFNHGFMCGAVLVASDGIWWQLSACSKASMCCLEYCVGLGIWFLVVQSLHCRQPGLWAPLWASLWKAIIVSASHDMAVACTALERQRSALRWLRSILPLQESFSGWWFHTFFIFHFIYGMSSFPLTFIFFRGVGIPPTSFWCEAFCGSGISASVECCVSLAQGVAAKLGHTHRSTCWFYVSGFNKCFCGVCLELYGKIAIKYMAI